MAIKNFDLNSVVCVLFSCSLVIQLISEIGGNIRSFKEKLMEIID
jgi:hypothetical protein